MLEFSQAKPSHREPFGQAMPWFDQGEDGKVMRLREPSTCAQASHHDAASFSFSYDLKSGFPRSASTSGSIGWRSDGIAGCFSAGRKCCENHPEVKRLHFTKCRLSIVKILPGIAALR